MTRAGTDDFPAGLDDWTTRDWADYRARVEDGEGSAHAIDAIQRRRRRQAQGKPSQDSAPWPAQGRFPHSRQAPSDGPRRQPAPTTR